MRELNDNAFYSPTSFAELRGCSIPTAQEIFNEKEFPSEVLEKKKLL